MAIVMVQSDERDRSFHSELTSESVVRPEGGEDVAEITGLSRGRTQQRQAGRQMLHHRANTDAQSRRIVPTRQNAPYISRRQVQALQTLAEYLDALGGEAIIVLDAGEDAPPLRRWQEDAIRSEGNLDQGHTGIVSRERHAGEIHGLAGASRVRNEVSACRATLLVASYRPASLHTKNATGLQSPCATRPRTGQRGPVSLVRIPCSFPKCRVFFWQRTCQVQEEPG